MGLVGIFFILIFVVVFLVLCGIGLAIGALIFAVAAAAIGFGMVSTSVACGILQRKPSAAFRAFFYQLFTVVFLCAGVILAWLVSAIAELHLSLLSVALIGSLSGVMVGLVFGVFHSWLVDLIAGALQRIFNRMLPSAGTEPAALTSAAVPVRVPGSSVRN